MPDPHLVPPMAEMTVRTPSPTARVLFAFGEDGDAVLGDGFGIGPLLEVDLHFFPTDFEVDGDLAPCLDDGMNC